MIGQCLHYRVARPIMQLLLSDDDFRRLLEREVVPLFYERNEQDVPRGWVRRMKQAMRAAGESFTTRRMVMDYTRTHYAPALRGARDADDPPTDVEHHADNVLPMRRVREGSGG